MQQLISDLLQYSRVGTKGKPFVDVPLNDVINRVKEDLSLVILEKRADIMVDDLPIIIADESQMRQLWQNLIGNALKFSNTLKPEIKITCQDKKEAWEFCIEDNGIGIDKDFAHKVFVIFQRLNSRDEYPGTGIGLAVCKKIVERHNGKIWFESEPGKGTKFYFTISKKLI